MDAMPKMLDKPSLETKLFPDMSNAQTKPHTQKPSMHVMPKKFAKPSWDKMFAETGRVGGLLPLFRRGLSLSVASLCALCCAKPCESCEKTGGVLPMPAMSSSITLSS